MCKFLVWGKARIHNVRRKWLAGKAGNGKPTTETTALDPAGPASKDHVCEQQLQCIQEDKALADEKRCENENEPPADSAINSIAGVAPLRRSGRERKLPHVRRESSGMVDSSSLRTRSVPARCAKPIRFPT